ncbi:MAG TPA: hypothetical protein VIO61_13455 [Anaerolineaceae bacterium]
MALEAAQSGYRILVAANNPILGFMFEILASAPRREDFLGALAALGSTRRGDERLETHLSSLYLTECPQCRQNIQAEAFIWRAGASAPHDRIINCSYCGAEGQYPVTTEDLARLSMTGSDSLHRSRAIERVSQKDELHRADVEDAIKIYLPRPLYVISTLINKLEGSGLPVEKRRLLQALIISAADHGNTLWAHPAGRSRPRQLTVPPEFRENNLWLSLSRAIDEWICLSEPVRLHHLPDLPPESGGICLYPGRIRAIPELPEGLTPGAIITSFPRPNQAFWTLSAIWAGWLWGREAVSPLKSILERKRFDWNWHTNAISGTLTTIRWWTTENFPFFGQIDDLTPGFLSAVMVAAIHAGFSLTGIAIRAEEEIAQLQWQTSPSIQQDKVIDDLENSIQKTILSHLEERAEPTRYIYLHASALTALKTPEPKGIGNDPVDQLVHVNRVIEKVLSNPRWVRRFESTSQEIERGWWGLPEYPTKAMPLSDRVEIELIRYLLSHPCSSSSAIDKALCAIFPGLHTPSRQWIDSCLSSYAEQPSNQEDCWKLRTQEEPLSRKQDIASCRQALQKIADRFGLKMIDADPVLWKNENGEIIYSFFLMASSIISRFVFYPQKIPLRRCVLVFPGSRSRLLNEKIHGNPQLAEAVAQGWRMLKFRHLRNLLDRNDLSLTLWDNLLDADPPFWEEAHQVSMF